MKLANILVILPALECGLSWAQNLPPTEEDELRQLLGEQQTISIATGTMQSQRLAPAITTVITADEIRKMGATDLDQVLESVPGIHVMRFSGQNYPAVVVRGIVSDLNPQILMLYDGIPLTILFQGNRSQLWGDLPLHNVARIEIIRGPGSALYGADAYSGVINIISKSAEQIAQGESGATIGSGNYRQLWAQKSWQYQDLSISSYLRLAKTGDNGKLIEQDNQTALDKLFNSHASLSPGPMKTGYRALDAALNFEYGQWLWRNQIILRDDISTGVGIASALDPYGRTRSERYTSDLSWKSALTGAWEYTARLNYMKYLQRIPVPVLLFPPGASFPTGSFPQGMSGAPNTSEYHLRSAVSLSYRGLEKHLIKIGLGHDDLNLYDTKEYKNFLLNPNGLPLPLAEMRFFTGPLSFLEPHRRTIDYVYLQDEWHLAPDWNLTTGLRHDRYSDVGSTTNPRLALVWEASYNLTAKLLYGSAFRAPSFVELYSINNPTQRGNPAIKPETIKSLEAALIWQASPRLQAKFAVFKFDMKNLIRTVPDTQSGSSASYANVAEQDGQGLEAEFIWQTRHDLRLSGNYSLQKNTDLSTQTDAGYAPRHHLFLRADWQLPQDWQSSLSLDYVAGRKRTANDKRPAVANYQTLDWVLNKKLGLWDFSLTLKNALNQDARSPSFAPGTITNDIPLAGRSIFLQARYKL